jgi:hypothetical protein
VPQAFFEVADGETLQHAAAKALSLSQADHEILADVIYWLAFILSGHHQEVHPFTS